MREYDSRKSRGCTVFAPVTLTGAVVYATADALASPGVSTSITQSGATRTTDLLKATMFIVTDLKSVNTSIMWCAMLDGLSILSVDFVTKKNGPYISMKRCMDTRRLIHVSDKFYDDHLQLSRILLSKIASQITKGIWRFESDEAKAKARRQPPVIAFLAEAELAMPERGCKDKDEDEYEDGDENEDGDEDEDKYEDGNKHSNGRGSICDEDGDGK